MSIECCSFYVASHSDSLYSCNVGYFTGSINRRDWTRQALSTVLADKFATYVRNVMSGVIRKEAQITVNTK